MLSLNRKMRLGKDRMGNEPVLSICNADNATVLPNQ